MVVVEVVGDHLEVVSEEALLARLLVLTEHVPRGTLVSEELIAERRAEAAREAAE
jgi:hypothetical protein